MRNLIIIIALIGYFSVAHCQTFKGTVYDRSTDSTLSFATVYISGTSIGTYSDIHGNFELDISKYSSIPITISLLGYYSVTLSEHNSNKMYDIYLSPKINELNEVVVTGKKGKWETYLRIFKREFLGETENASECDILNENDLRFFYNSDSSTLREISLKPILIRNKALGYTITYYLDKFKFSRHRVANGQLTETCAILGNYLFKDDLLTLSESEKSKIEERRKSAYLGSRMHFFRSLYNGNLIQRGQYSISISDNGSFTKGFSINSKTPINSDSFIIKKDSLSGYLKNARELSVTYKWMNTLINIKWDSVYFEKDGYYDPVGVEFSGDMSKQRIGDLLPFEYF
jgi:CarboxypepD_reg-like domain